MAELNKRCTQIVDDEEGGCVTTLDVVKGDVVSFINNPENNGAVFQVTFY